MMWSVTKEMYPQSLAAAAWVPGMSAELGSGQTLPILLSHQSDYGLTNRHLPGFMSVTGRWTISSLPQGLQDLLAFPIALMILALRLRHGLHRRDPRCRWAVAERSRGSHLVFTQCAGEPFLFVAINININRSKGSL